MAPGTVPRRCPAVRSARSRSRSRNNAARPAPARPRCASADRTEPPGWMWPTVAGDVMAARRVPPGAAAGRRVDADRQHEPTGLAIDLGGGGGLPVPGPQRAQPAAACPGGSHPELPAQPLAVQRAGYRQGRRPARDIPVQQRKQGSERVCQRRSRGRRDRDGQRLHPRAALRAEPDLCGRHAALARQPPAAVRGQLNELAAAHASWDTKTVLRRLGALTDDGPSRIARNPTAEGVAFARVALCAWP